MPWIEPWGSRWGRLTYIAFPLMIALLRNAWRHSYWLCKGGSLLLCIITVMEDPKLNLSVDSVVNLEDIQSGSVPFPDTAVLIRENSSSFPFLVASVETYGLKSQLFSPPWDFWLEKSTVLSPRTSTLLRSLFSAQTCLHTPAFPVAVFLLKSKKSSTTSVCPVLEIWPFS